MGTASEVPLLTDAPAPLGAQQRLHALDILRGFALFGMILVHFHQKLRTDATGLEDLIGWAVWILVEQKAWGTFAFLFGVGFAVLLRRLEARGAPVAVIYCRRLAALAVFGVIAEVGFGFHILFEYACWGVPLLLIRRWSTRTLVLTAVLAASARPIAAELTALWSWWTAATPPVPGAQRALAEAVTTAAQQPAYGPLLAARWALFLGSFPHGWKDLLPGVNFALFVVGALAVRLGVLDAPREHLRLIRGWMIFGAVSWLLAWVVLRRIPALPIPGTTGPLAYGLGLVQDQWLCFTYIGAVVLLLAYRPQWASRLSLVGQAGRMALTNYLLQAAILDFLSSGYGLALSLRPYHYALGAVVLFGIEAFLSALWLSRFRFGPLEWLWRSVTYARRQPLRREAPPLVAQVAG